MTLKSRPTNPISILLRRNSLLLQCRLSRNTGTWYPRQWFNNKRLIITNLRGQLSNFQFIAWVFLDIVKPHQPVNTMKLMEKMNEMLGAMRVDWIQAWFPQGSVAERYIRRQNISFYYSKTRTFPSTLTKFPFFLSTSGPIFSVPQDPSLEIKLQALRNRFSCWIMRNIGLSNPIDSCTKPQALERDMWDQKTQWGLFLGFASCAHSEASS